MSDVYTWSGIGRSCFDRSVFGSPVSTSPSTMVRASERCGWCELPCRCAPIRGRRFSIPLKRSLERLDPDTRPTLNRSGVFCSTRKQGDCLDERTCSVIWCLVHRHAQVIEQLRDNSAGRDEGVQCSCGWGVPPCCDRSCSPCVNRRLIVVGSLHLEGDAVVV